MGISTPLLRARLYTDLAVRTPSATFELQGTIFLCPSCESTDLEILSGTELQVVEVALKDDAPLS